MIDDLREEDVLKLAKVGLTALIDEATGYQSVRKDDVLRDMLKENKNKKQD